MLTEISNHDFQSGKVLEQVKVGGIQVSSGAAFFCQKQPPGISGLLKVVVVYVYEDMAGNDEWELVMEWRSLSWAPGCLSTAPAAKKEKK